MHLHASVETTPRTNTPGYSFGGPPLSNAIIREKYPKLKIKVSHCLINTHFNFDGSEGIQGAFVSLAIDIKNPRSSRILIADFKLDTLPHVERITGAAQGFIYRTVAMVNGRPENYDRLTPNLRDAVPIEADWGEPIQGWIQFYLKDIRPKQLAGKNATLIVVDSSGEKHRCETPEFNLEQPQPIIVGGNIR